MNRDILSLDFYGGEIIAALAAQDEETDTLRIRCLFRRPSRSFSGAFVRDMLGAREELSKVFEEVSGYVSFSPSVVVGLRGNFLSFKRSSGFKSIDSRSRVIGSREMDEAARTSVPLNLSDTLEVVDILPQFYSLDGNIRIKNPRGMIGSILEVETFLSFATVSHLDNLNQVFSDCECNEYQIMPSSVATGETLLTPEEKQAGVLLLDISSHMTSALLYHKETLMAGWELSFGTDRLLEAAHAGGQERLALLMEAICSTGIRVSEVRYLTVEAAKAERAEIRLKGKIRVILLPRKLCRKLLKYAAKNKTASGEIFLTRNGKSLSRRQIWAEMKRLCRKAEVEPSKVFPHNLRHLFATLFYRACKDIVRLADVLGHSSIETTRIYLCTTGMEHIRVLERMRLNL